MIDDDQRFRVEEYIKSAYVKGRKEQEWADEVMLLAGMRDIDFEKAVYAIREGEAKELTEKEARKAAAK